METETQKLYYIRNEGYVGNALVWWAENSRGYTTDIRKAGKYTFEDAENICKRIQDTAYETGYIDNLIEAQKLIIDYQYIDNSHQLFN